MVSIVMPAYNAEKYIREAIQSVLCQTYEEWELLVIDDCSTDGTYSVVEKMSKDDDRIKLYKNQQNMGVSQSRNKAVELARGEWIAFLDSDDAWMPEKLSKQVSIAKTASDMVICYTASSFIDDDGKPYDYVMEVEETISYKTLLSKNLISCSSVMIRSSVMKQIKMPSDKMHEDYYVWLKVLREGGKAYGINEPLLRYRLAANSKSSNRLKSAKMSYRTYRAVGYNFLTASFLVFRYAFYSVAKRRKIYHSASHE